MRIDLIERQVLFRQYGKDHEPSQAKPGTPERIFLGRQGELGFTVCAETQVRRAIRHDLLQNDISA